MRCARSVFIVVALGAVALETGCSGGGGKGGSGRSVAATRSSSVTPPASGKGPASGGPAPVTPPGKGPALTPAARPGVSRFLYSANYGDQSITELTIDPLTGAPTVFGSVALGDVPLRLAVHPSDRFLYSIERSEVTPFAVDATTGGLTPIGSPVVLTGDYPLGARVSPNGQLLLCGYYGGSTGGSVRSFAIGAAGDLAPVDRFALGPTANPVDVVVHPTSRFAFVADGISETITVLAIDPATGKLGAVGGPVPCPGVAALALEARGAFLVAMTSFSPGSIEVFAIDSSGAITPRGAPLSTGPHSAMAIEAAPDGKTFHVVTANSSLVTVLLDAQGGLTTASVTPVPAYGFPGALALDASGKFVYTANFAGDDLSVLSIGASGAITAGPNVPIAPRTSGNTTQPYWVATVR